MSRVAKKPIPLPKGVQVTMSGQTVSVKGAKHTLQMHVNESVGVEQADGELLVSARADTARALAGTTRALLSNMVAGVDKGFTRKLELVGVGYRAQVQGKNLNLTLGFSHPVAFKIPEGITVETPSQTEIVVKGPSKQQVGQVAAEIRAYRPPEPYNGKGVKYSDEVIVRKEAKKK